MAPFACLSRRHIHDGTADFVMGHGPQGIHCRISYIETDGYGNQLMWAWTVQQIGQTRVKFAEWKWLASVKGRVEKIRSRWCQWRVNQRAEHDIRDESVRENAHKEHCNVSLKNLIHTHKCMRGECTVYTSSHRLQSPFPASETPFVPAIHLMTTELMCHKEATMLLLKKKKVNVTKSATSTVVALLDDALGMPFVEFDNSTESEGYLVDQLAVGNPWWFSRLTSSDPSCPLGETSPWALNVKFQLFSYLWRFLLVAV